MELTLSRHQAHPPHHTITPPPPRLGPGPPPTTPRRLRSPVDPMAAGQRASSGNSSSSSAARPRRTPPPPVEEAPSIVFLHHDPGATSADGSNRRQSSSALTAAARAHASRRGHSKNAEKARKSFRFVSISTDGLQTPSGIATDNDDNERITSSQPGSRKSSIAFSSHSGLRRSVARPPDYHARQQAQGQQNFFFVDSSTALVNAGVSEAAETAAPPRSLTADRWDPFDSLSVHNLSKSEQFMLHYALTTTWAKFGESQSGQAELAQSWIWATVESPAALFAQIAGAAAHYLTVPYADGASQRNTFTTMLQTKQKAIKALQHEVDLFQRRQAEDKAEQQRRELEQSVSDTTSPGAISPFTQTPSQWAPPVKHSSSSQKQPQTLDLPIRDYPTPHTATSPIQAESPPSTSSSPSLSTSVAAQPVSASAAAAAGATDSMVLAILVLAVHDSIDLTPVPEPHPMAPLATYRDMHIYGQMSFKEVHMTMLYGLVEQKGGLTRMNHSVFGYVLPPADMLFNLRRGSPPRIPSHRVLRPLRGTNAWQPDYQAGFLLTAVGTGFQAVQVPSGQGSTITTGLDEEMLSLIHVMAELTVAFDHFVRASPGAPKSLDFFVNNADLVGHRLMSKPSYFDEPVEVFTPSVSPAPTQQPQNSRAYASKAASASSSAISSPSYSLSSPSPPAFPQSQSDIGTIFTSDGIKILRYPRSTILRELSRVAANLYTDMVIFPTPARTGVKLRNAAQMLPLLRAFRRDRLRNQMSGLMSTADWAAEDADEEKIRHGFLESSMEGHEYYRVEIVDEDNTNHTKHETLNGEESQAYRPIPQSPEALQDFISWALLLSTICTRFTPLADTYITELSLDLEMNYHQQQAYAGGIPVSMPQVLMQQQYGGPVGQTWPEYRARMMRFLWLGSVCDEAGEGVWREAMALRGQKNVMVRY